MTKKRKNNILLAQMTTSCDQLWSYVQEDSILEKLYELREHYSDKNDPTDKEVLICICSTLVFSEALKRRTEKAVL
jgi:hypothetical protein